MRPSSPNANALRSSSMVCNGFSRSAICAPAGGIVQHPKMTHTSAHRRRSHRYRLEQKQITSCLSSSLRSECHHPGRQCLAKLLALLRCRLYFDFPNLLQPLPQSRLKSLIRRLVIRAPRQILRQASHVRNFFLEVMRIFVTFSIANIFHQSRHCIPQM